MIFIIAKNWKLGYQDVSPSLIFHPSSVGELERDPVIRPSGAFLKAGFI